MTKDGLEKMTKEEREKKLKELKIELIKAGANAAKGGNSRSKQIRKIIAKVHTLNASKKNKEVLNKE
jgi:ribosomal protein L29